MQYLLTSCLVLFFLFSLIHHILCASSKKEPGWCEALFQCGNITAGFPFSGGNRPKVCGHPILELHCINNITSLFISNQEFYVLRLNQTFNSLTLARPDHLGSFCSSTFINTTLPPEIFELSPTYKSVTVFYLCDSKLSYPSKYTCPEKGLVSVSQNLDYHNSCPASFTVNVPKSYVSEQNDLNLTHLESVLREGFEVKVKIDEKECRKCSSYHAFCGFDETLPLGVNCVPLNPPDADELRKRCSERFSCGDQTDLYYPFWKSGREDCGHPDLKLECNASFAEVRIFSVKFRILEANYTSRIIRLARSDYISNICPQNPLYTHLNENITLFTSDTEMLTIYYDCRQNLSLSKSVSTYVGELSCEVDDGRNYYVTRSLSSPLLKGSCRSLLYNFGRFCSRNVSIPASGLALDILQNNMTQDNLKKALEEGFTLGLNRDCVRCIDSSGACGYNKISSRFVCYCEGWTRNHICDPLFLGMSYSEIIGLGLLFGQIVVSYLIVRILLSVIIFK